MKYRIDFTADEFDSLTLYLERYLESLDTADEIRAVVKILDKIENDYKEIED